MYNGGVWVYYKLNWFGRVSCGTIVYANGREICNLQSQNKQCRIYDDGNILLLMVPLLKSHKFCSQTEQGMRIGNGVKNNLVHLDVK